MWLRWDLPSYCPCLTAHIPGLESDLQVRLTLSGVFPFPAPLLPIPTRSRLSHLFPTATSILQGCGASLPDLGPALW